MMTHKKANIVITLMTAFTVLFWCWYLCPYNPLEVSEIKVMNENNQVCIGDNLIYEVTYIKNTTKTPTLDKTLVDGIIFHLANTTAYSPSNLELGVETTGRVLLPIPSTVPEGEYYLNIEANYQMNPIQNVIVDFQTKEFDIIKCD